MALSFWIGTGSRDETGAEAGMSHFLEHLLFKGSDTRSALDIAEAIDGAGGDMNAFTTKEATAFYVRVLGEDVEVALDILCDIMCAPAFDPVEVEAERQVVLEEILMRNDEPGDLAHDYFDEVLFGAHPLGRDILGHEEHIVSMSAEDIATFFEHHYRPRNLVFSAAGALDHDEMVEAVAKRWSRRDGGQAPQRQAPATVHAERREVERPTDQTHLVAGVRAPDRYDSDRYATSVLDVILGGGMSSRLFQEVREKRGLAYTVFSSYTPFHDTGQLSIYLGTAPKRVAEAEAVVNTELRRICSDGVTAEELERAKRHLRTTTLLGLEDTTSRMSRNGRSLLMHGEILSVDEVSKRIAAVTLDDVGRMANDLLSSEPSVVTVGPQ